jgi:hypothetical protein
LGRTRRTDREMGQADHRPRAAAAIRDGTNLAGSRSG